MYVIEVTINDSGQTYDVVPPPPLDCSESFAASWWRGRLATCRIDLSWRVKRR